MKSFIPLAAFATVSALAITSFVKIIDDFKNDDEVKPTNETKETVFKKMQKVQNELARLHDLKTLNLRRESTGQVKEVTIKIDDIEIDELISKLVNELDILTEKYNTTI